MAEGLAVIAAGRKQRPYGDGVGVERTVVELDVEDISPTPRASPPPK